MVCMCGYRTMYTGTVHTRHQRNAQGRECGSEFRPFSPQQQQMSNPCTADIPRPTPPHPTRAPAPRPLSPPHTATHMTTSCSRPVRCAASSSSARGSEQNSGRAGSAACSWQQVAWWKEPHSTPLPAKEEQEAGAGAGAAEPASGCAAAAATAAATAPPAGDCPLGDAVCAATAGWAFSFPSASLLTPSPPAVSVLTLLFACAPGRGRYRASSSVTAATSWGEATLTSTCSGVCGNSRRTWAGGRGRAGVEGPGLRGHVRTCCKPA